jgi:molybdenum cofactor cytidylyltransferase
VVTNRDANPPRTGEVHAVVLAAGAGSRLGGGKLRRDWRGRPLLHSALDAALAAPVEAVWLVLGADAALTGLIPTDARLHTVSAPEWAQGLSASLKAGIAALPSETAAALVFLGDMPRLPQGLAAQLIDAWKAGATAAAPLFDGQRGHPVLLDRSLFGEVARLQGDRGAGALLSTLGDRLTLIPAPDDGVLFDIDTEEALAR